MRELQIELERKTGTIHNLTVVMNDCMLATGPGKVTWKGEMPANANFLIHAVGTEGSTFECSFDVEGTANDFKQTFKLKGSSIEVEFAL